LVPFDFNLDKSAANQAKHGIDFVAAQALWADPDRIERVARSVDEPRYQVIGQIRQILWTATVTNRHEKIRIISVRRARPRERALYEEARQHQQE
jgi:uncharacterized DUF497 family protein